MDNSKKQKKSPDEFSEKGIQKFADLLNKIEFSDIFVRKLSFEKMGAIEPGLNVNVNANQPSIEIKDNSINATIGFLIEITSSEKKVFSMNAVYDAFFTSKELDYVKKLLEDEEVKNLFLNKQLLKLVWPFLREDFHTSNAKIGIRPMTLPLLK